MMAGDVAAIERIDDPGGELGGGEMNDGVGRHEPRGHQPDVAETGIAWGAAHLASSKAASSGVSAAWLV